MMWKVLSVWLLTCLAAAVQAAPPAGTAIVNDDSYVRAFLCHKTPMAVGADGVVKVALGPGGKDPKPVEEFQSPLPPADWRGPDFDDSTWIRQRSPVEVAPGGATGRRLDALHTASRSSLLCLRWRFVVNDPAAAGDLKLSLEYVGGVAAYVNGREVARAHLPAGELAPDALAEKYPDDLHCRPDGTYLQDIKADVAGFERRYRKLAGAVVPARLLRKGVNVLALEVHRSPINEAAIAARRVPVGGMYVVPGLWAYAGLRHVDLSAAAGAPVVPDTARPVGVQVWTCTPYETIEATDYGEPCDKPVPVVVPALRNGAFSGRLVVSSDGPVRGLKVTVSDLVQSGGAKLPASRVRVRYAAAATRARSWVPPYRFDALLDAPPAEAPVSQVPPRREEYLGQRFDRKGPTAGAIVPVWLTVRVPADAAPGRYEGAVTIVAEGLPAPAAVPIRVTVHAWVLPDPKDSRIRNFGMTEPENLASHYGAELWSDRHFELLGKSMALMAEVNSRLIVLNLVNQFYGTEGNSQSVVRWIRKPNGALDHDFAVFDRFLDAAARKMGKPALVRINCWAERRKGSAELALCGRTVSLLDAATGRVSPMEHPEPGSEESLAFWKPVLAEVRKRLEARGWLDAAAIGHNSYCYHADPAVVSVARSIWPDGVWAYSAHNGQLGMSFAAAEGEKMPVGFAGCVWTEGRLDVRNYGALLSPRPAVWWSHARNRFYDASGLNVLRELPEEMLLRGHDGVGDFGVDLFPLPKSGRTNEYRHVDMDKSAIGPDCSTVALLAAGPDGPVASERFEAFREGVQIAEALLMLQHAAQDAGIALELRQKLTAYLDRRGADFIRMHSGKAYRPDTTAGRFERDEQLFALAGEVATGPGK